MTVAIKESLSILNEYIEDLEQKAQEAQSKAQRAVDSAGKRPQKKAGAPDLFSVPSGGDVDAKALASRLDGAIAKVEKLLKEEA